jgi:hypothetical protein
MVNQLIIYLEVLTMKYYTGIGSRRTPVELSPTIIRLASKLNGLGYRLRTGDAYGADEMFSTSVLEADIYSVSSLKGLSPSALAKTSELVKAHHPADQLSDYSFRLHQRNALQVLGEGLDTPSKFIICWASGSKIDLDGRIADVNGGTGQAVRIAYAYGVPCFNLDYQPHFDRLTKWLKGE